MMPAQDSTAQTGIQSPSRREFLYYIWGASIVMFMGQASAGLIWFARPRFKEGEFGGEFRFTPDAFPGVDAPPVQVAKGRMHLVNTGEGLLALYNVCTHLGCLPRWSDVNHRFECPCHGSKFELNGAYIEGVAPRGLDRFAMTLRLVDDGTEITTRDGSPLALPISDVVEIIVDTGQLIDGPARS